MSDPKWTPGEWRVRRWMEGEPYGAVLGPDGERIATFHNLREEGVANQQLGSVAPALYKKLREIELTIGAHAMTMDEEECENDPICREWGSVKALLALARGES